MSATAAKRGWSFARILLLTAVVGVGLGTLLGAVVNVELDPVAAQEQELDLKPMPQAAAGDPMAPDPASLAGLPEYPQVSPRRLIRRTERQQVPMSVSWFSTHDPASTVLDFYWAALNAQERHPVSHRVSADMGYVAWLEELPDAGLAGGILHMVSAVRQHSQTMVLVSASRPDLAMGVAAALPEGLVLPPASTPAQVVELGEAQMAHQVVYSRTLETSVAAVEEFFSKQLTNRGFVVEESRHTEQQSQLSAHKAGATVTVSARAEGRNVAVVVSAQHAREEPK